MNHHLCAKVRILLVLVCCTLLSVCVLAESAVPSDFTLRYGDRNTPRIAITIDDCFDSEHILEAIELCEEYGIAVTFFPIGDALKFADGELWQHAIDAGCEIGNHSWGHIDLTTLSTREIRFQMLRPQQKLDEMLGYHYPMQVMRPPFGKSNGTVSKAVASVGYLHVVKWDVSQTDARKAIKDVQNGSILLYHARARDIRCLCELIPQLLEQGYECVTVSDLLELDPITPREGIYKYYHSHSLEGKPASSYLNQ